MIPSIAINISIKHQVLPLRAVVDLGVLVMKEYSKFPKAPTLLERHHQIVLSHIRTLVVERMSTLL